MLNKNVQWLKLESQLFKGVGAGAGEKITRSRSKADRLRNTAVSIDFFCRKNLIIPGSGKKHL